MITIGKLTELPVGERKVQNVWVTAQVFAKRYVGDGWKDKDLQLKAETGLWFAKMSGHPHVLEGSGSTPELAARDMLRRTEQHINDLQRSISHLTF